jgi:hypothetical protein
MLGGIKRRRRVEARHPRQSTKECYRQPPAAAEGTAARNCGDPATIALHVPTTEEPGRLPSTVKHTPQTRELGGQVVRQIATCTGKRVRRRVYVPPSLGIATGRRRSQSRGSSLSRTPLRVRRFGVDRGSLIRAGAGTHDRLVCDLAVVRTLRACGYVGFNRAAQRPHPEPNARPRAAGCSGPVSIVVDQIASEPSASRSRA